MQIHLGFGPRTGWRGRLFGVLLVVAVLGLLFLLLSGLIVVVALAFIAVVAVAVVRAVLPKGGVLWRSRGQAAPAGFQQPRWEPGRAASPAPIVPERTALPVIDLEVVEETPRPNGHHR